MSDLEQDEKSSEVKESEAKNRILDNLSATSIVGWPAAHLSFEQPF